MKVKECFEGRKEYLRGEGMLHTMKRYASTFKTFFQPQSFFPPCTAVCKSDQGEIDAFEMA